MLPDAHIVTDDGAGALEHIPLEHISLERTLLSQRSQKYSILEKIRLAVKAGVHALHGSRGCCRVQTKEVSLLRINPKYSASRPCQHHRQASGNKYYDRICSAGLCRPICIVALGALGRTTDLDGRETRPGYGTRPPYRARTAAHGAGAGRIRSDLEGAPPTPSFANSCLTGCRCYLWPSVWAGLAKGCWGKRGSGVHDDDRQKGFTVLRLKWWRIMAEGV